MHVVHVIRDLDAASGGPSCSMPALARGLARVDSSLHITTLFQDRGNETTIHGSDPSTGNFLSVSAASMLGPLRIHRQLQRTHEESTINLLHLHGLWSPSVHVAARFARTRGIPYVITPRGMLSAWSLNNKSLRKRIAWSSYQQQDLQRAHCIHATSDAEANDVRSSGLTAPIAMIPHGCDLPPERKKLYKSEVRTAVCVTRIHPVKGLDDLIDAWAAVGPRDWRLVIAGPDDHGYGSHLREKIYQHRVGESVQLVDEVRGSEKWDLLASAELSVSASHSENFGMSIAESLAMGLPVITTDATPWQTIQQNNCGWWVPVGREGLSAAIKTGTSLSRDALGEMGSRGTRLIQSTFTWDAIAARMLAVYRWIVDHKCDVPKDIRSVNSNDIDRNATCSST